MTSRVLVFAEDSLGVTLARDLYDRVVTERGPIWMADLWSDAEVRETQREWFGLDSPDGYTKWKIAPKLAQGRGIATHGLGLKAYALVAYRAARIVAKTTPRPDVVVLCIDTDGRATTRQEMLEGWRRGGGDDQPVALAIAHQESEAWVVAGFIAESRAEEAVLRDLEVEHGFVPVREPHRMTPKRQTDPHDAKRIFASLFGNGEKLSARAEKCWRETPLDYLERCGDKTGLPEYLADVARVIGAAGRGASGPSRSA